MGQIRLLADPLIDRIAAGEVVERPASIVKELVENSLDAGARRISVLLESGGKQRIRVTDDGCGMDADDARLAVERHATSKLRCEADLDEIATLGFRGEALSSIASVSRFLLRTARKDGEGTEVEIHGGRLVDVRGAGLPRGTTVQADRLFYNVPARRKFLRADGTELSHALRWLTRYALAHPERQFRLTHGERRLLDAPATGDALERIAQVHGRDFAEKLLPVSAEGHGLSVRGFAGRPVDSLPRRDAQHLFVNQRAVQDRMLNHAVMAAYRNTMPQGRFPALFLFLELDPGMVDVNVHPQKTEVRFRDGSRIHDLVRGAIAGALSETGCVPRLSDLRPDSIPAPATEVREAALAYLDRQPARPVPSASPPPSSASFLDDPADTPETAAPATAAALAQFQDSYILAQDREGLVLVDQHAAHERVIFERYLADAEADRVEVQQLMFPVTLELTPQEAALVERDLGELRRLGLRLEPFGGTAVRLDGVPAVAGGIEPETLFRELLGQAAEVRSAVAEGSELRRRLITSAACQAAIKIHHPLGLPAMQALIDDLFRVENPTTCPHGRPALFRLTLEEIERAFRRR